jgi:serine/threonine-protein kinase
MVPESESRIRSRLSTTARSLRAAVSATWRKLWQSPRTSESFGDYTLGEKLGEGGMGVVHKASHRTLGRPAALKLLPAERADGKTLQRFRREVELTSRLTHPNTVRVYDFGRTAGGTYYYAMEYVDGVDLQTLVEREGPQHPVRVTHLLVQLAGALSEAHTAGLVHRDVKPANVMVCERVRARDVVKVLDFGLVRDVRPDATCDVDPRQVVGTPLYMSPEAITAPENVDARSDVYAIGALAYFLLTGAPPFSGRNAVEVLGHHVYSAPEPLSARRPAIPSPLESLILRCLAKSPADRPANAAALRAELLALSSECSDASVEPCALAA